MPVASCLTRIKDLVTRWLLRSKAQFSMLPYTLIKTKTFMYFINTQKILLLLLLLFLLLWFAVILYDMFTFFLELFQGFHINSTVALLGWFSIFSQLFALLYLWQMHIIWPRRKILQRWLQVKTCWCWIVLGEEE